MSFILIWCVISWIHRVLPFTWYQCHSANGCASFVKVILVVNNESISCGLYSNLASRRSLEWRAVLHDSRTESEQSAESVVLHRIVSLLDVVTTDDSISDVAGKGIQIQLAAFLSTNELQTSRNDCSDLAMAKQSYSQPCRQQQWQHKWEDRRRRPAPSWPRHRPY